MLECSSLMRQRTGERTLHEDTLYFVADGVLWVKNGDVGPFEVAGTEQRLDVTENKAGLVQVGREGQNADTGTFPGWPDR